MALIPVLTLIGFAGCGAAPRDTVVAQAAHATITGRELREWMAILAPGHFVPDPPHYEACVSHEEANGQQQIGNALQEDCATQYAALKVKALRFLISSDWLVAEATAHHRGPSRHEVTAWLATSRGRVKNMSSSASRLLARRELALRTVEQEIRTAEAPTTGAQVTRYYARHIRAFERRERRYLDITEDLPTRTAALRTLRELIARNGRGIVAIHEFYDRFRPGEPLPASKRVIFKAIFSARVGVYVGPFHLNGYYAIFRITHITPRVVTPLARVASAITQKLSVAQHRRTLARFLEAWTKRWKAVTRCHSGYVVPECGSYAGSPSYDAPVGLR